MQTPPDDRFYELRDRLRSALEPVELVDKEHYDEIAWSLWLFHPDLLVREIFDAMDAAQGAVPGHPRRFTRDAGATMGRKLRLCILCEALLLVKGVEKP
jgi:hypothetical protein